MNDPDWFRVANVDEVPSPALLVYPERVEANVRRMVAIAGDPARLRPHVKTHKMPELARMQLRHGITRFKCATIAEAEMLAGIGAPDVLLAYPCVGPTVLRLVSLIQTFPDTRFRTLADDPDALRALSDAASRWLPERPVDVLIDLDTGMGRSGIAPDRADDLYRLLASLPGLVPGGLHAYDGHLYDPDADLRARRVADSYAPVQRLKARLEAAGLPVPRVVASGTPTFGVHAARGDVECGPGTSVFSDGGYELRCPELGFVPAALVLTRVVSRPGDDRLCLDLGHKGIAAENPHPRVRLFGLDDAEAVGHSEEHLVLQTPRAREIPVGTAFYGLPWHICPTVALYDEAAMVENGHVARYSPVVARSRRLTT